MGLETHPLGTVFRGALHGVLNLLLPFRCAACGRPETRAPMAATPIPTGLAGERRPLMRLLCRVCRDTIRPVTAPLCEVCGRPFAGAGGGDHRCGDCVAHPPRMGKMRAAAIYQGAMVLLVRQLKYQRAVHLAAAMGPWLAASYLWHWRPPGDTVDIVVPVPLHRRRLRQRGYNQSWLMARQVFGERASGDGPRLLEVLVRSRDTPSQTGLDREMRRRNLKGAFEVADGAAVAGKHVLLLDDVITTGETMGACTDVLLAAGALRVDALCMARTPRRNQ